VCSSVLWWICLPRLSPVSSDPKSVLFVIPTHCITSFQQAKKGAGQEKREAKAAKELKEQKARERLAKKKK
jgi:hypothetical protein